MVNEGLQTFYLRPSFGHCPSGCHCSACSGSTTTSVKVNLKCKCLVTLYKSRLSYTISISRIAGQIFNSFMCLNLWRNQLGQFFRNFII